jgi:hypothetical protein
VLLHVFTCTHSRINTHLRICQVWLVLCLFFSSPLTYALVLVARTRIYPHAVTPKHTPAYVSIRQQHNIRQHTSAYAYTLTQSRIKTRHLRYACTLISQTHIRSHSPAFSFFPPFLFPATQFASCTRKRAQKKISPPSLALTKRMALPTPKVMALTR